MRINSEHIKAFQRASHDRNPLHVDADYARRTPFGRPVAYGVCAVLLALSEWAQGRTFQLRQLRAVFKKPLFQGEDYVLELVKSGKKTS